MRFVLMRNGLDLPTAAARSQVIAFKNRNEPTNGHLALTRREGCVQPLLQAGPQF